MQNFENFINDGYLESHDHGPLPEKLPGQILEEMNKDNNEDQPFWITIPQNISKFIDILFDKAAP